MGYLAPTANYYVVEDLNEDLFLKLNETERNRAVRRSKNSQLVKENYIQVSLHDNPKKKPESGFITENEWKKGITRFHGKEFFEE